MNINPCNETNKINFEYSLTTEKPKNRDLLLSVLKTLGEHGLNSWDQLDIEAKKLGISDPKAIVAHHCGQVVLKQANYLNESERNHILIEALLQNTLLPIEDLLPLCQAIGSRIDAKDCEALVSGYLSALGVTKDTVDFWKKIFQVVNSDRGKKICSHLVLLRDKEIFEKKGLGFPSVDLILGIALSQLTQNAAPLFSDSEIKKLTECPPLQKMAVIARLAEEPALCCSVGKLFDILNPHAFLEKYAALQNEVPENLSRAMLAWFLTKSDQKADIKSIKNYFAWTKNEYTDLVAYFLRRPERVNSEVIELLCIEKGFSGSPLLKASDQEWLIPLLVNSTFLMDETKNFLMILYENKISVVNAFILYQGHYLLNSKEVAEIFTEKATQELLHKLVACLAKKRLSGVHSEMPISFLKSLLNALPPTIRKTRFEELHAYACNGSPQVKEDFAKFFEGLMDLDCQKDIFIRHLQLLNVSSKDLEQWTNAFNDQKLLGNVPAKVLETAMLCLPFLVEKEAFEQDLQSRNPIHSFLKRVMTLENEKEQPKLLEMGVAQFLGREKKNPKGHFDMILLALQLPKYRNALSEFKEYSGQEYNINEIEKGFHLFENPKIALAWALAANIQEGLTSRERAELLLKMHQDVRVWKEDVARSLTECEFEQDDANILLNNIFQSQGLDAEQVAACKKAIFSASIPVLKMMLPYLKCVTSEDSRSFNFAGGEDRLFLSILIAVLKKKPPQPFAPLTTEKLKIIKSLPSTLALKLNTALTTATQDTAAVLSDLCRIQFIGLQEEGSARNSWEMYALAQMKNLAGTKEPSPLSLDLEKAWKEASTQKPEIKQVEWLLSLEAQGWKFNRVFGRTHLYKNEENGKILAIKWQKAEEDEAELFKEKATLEVVRQYQQTLGLLSEFPKPIGVYQFEEALPEGYFKNTEVATLAAKGGEKVAYIYEFPNEDYFIYLNNPQESQEKVEIKEKYSKARSAFIKDLFVLAKNGLIMTQLADIFHRSAEKKMTRDDHGRYMTMNFLVRDYVLSASPGELTGIGNGRLHHLEKAVQYPNAGYNGVRDIGDSALLFDLKNPDNPFSQKHFSALMAKNPDKATAYILANFLAEYLLVYELLITERLAQFEQNQLDWKDPQKVEMLAEELKEGFINALCYYSGLSHSLSKRFIENTSVDWIRAAKQLHFFHRNDEKGYRPFNKDVLMPKEIYGDVIVAPGPDFWSLDTGMSDGGSTRHRGTFSGTDPVKEPEKGRVILMTHMLLLEKAQKEARKLCFQANAVFYDNKGTENEIQASHEALKFYQEALELWPFDKEVYKSLSKVYTVLGNKEKAEACQWEWAALTIQNARPY